MKSQAVIYCRVSTKEQTQNLSLPTQLKACRDYCAREGYAAAETFIDEGESAKTADRPELQRLLTYCREHKGRVTAVVVYNVTRFARQKYDHVILRATLWKLGITLRSVMEPIDDSPSGKLMEGVLAAFAQFDNDQKSERTENGMRAALQLGRWTFQAPLGFLNSESQFEPSLRRDDSRADLIALGFKLVSEGTKVSDALSKLAAAGLRTRKGRDVSSQTFRAILRNPIYAGRVEVSKWQISRDGDFQAIIDKATFGSVQRRLDGKRTETRAYARQRADFPLRSLLRCAGCQGALTGSWSKGRSARYGYYHCAKCSRVRAPREFVENLFIGRLECLQPDPGYMRLFREIVLDVWRAQQGRSRDVAAKLDSRLAQLRGRLDRVEEAFIYDRTIDRPTYEQHRDKLREEIALAELALHDARIESIDVEGVLGFADHLLTNAARIWLGATLDQRQQFQQAIFPEGLSFDGREFGTAATCLAFKQLPSPRDEKEGVASPPGFEPGFQP